MWVYNELKPLCRSKNCAINRNSALVKKDFLVNVNSLYYDNLLHLEQIFTKLASLQLALNEVFENL